jgi:hypothetical protein
MQGQKRKGYSSKPSEVGAMTSPMDGNTAYTADTLKELPSL